MPYSACPLIGDRHNWPYAVALLTKDIVFDTGALPYKYRVIRIVFITGFDLK